MGIRWENTALGTESARNFFAIIGPLQLGVVLFSPPYTLYRLKGVISLFHETPSSHLLTFLVNFYGAYERGLVIIYITMACIFLGKMGEKIHFGY